MRIRSAVIFCLAVGATGSYGAFRYITAARARDEYRAALADVRAEAARRDADIAFYTKRSQEDPAGAFDLSQLAMRYLGRSRATGDFNDVLRAEKLARNSLSLRSSHNIETFVPLISSLLSEHRFNEARDVAKQLVSEDPVEDSYRAILGEVDLEVGDYDGAGKAFLSLSAKSRANLGIAPRLARWLEIRGNSTMARQILYRTEEMADSTRDQLTREQLAWFHLRVADIELRNGRLRGAEKAIRAGREVLPNDYRLLAAEARLASVRHDWQRAISAGDSSVAIVLDPATLGLVGDAYAALGDSAKAEEYIRTMEVAVTQQPGAYHRAWSLFLLDHGMRIPEVTEKIREELRTRRDIYGYDLLGWALYKQGHYAEARDALATAMSQGTQDAVVYYHAGMIELAGGRAASARRLLERAMAINPYFDATHPAQVRATLGSLLVNP
jgi:tetratricopeptide (TPR) repeat protein